MHASNSFLDFIMLHFRLSVIAAHYTRRSPNSADDSWSRKTVASGCVFSRVAGHAVEMSSSMTRRTIAALRLPGTDTISFGTRNSVGTVKVIARVGTPSSDGNQPSATCCSRHLLSRIATLTACGSLKSASLGSLKARCPFSPIPSSHNLGSAAFRRAA